MFSNKSNLKNAELLYTTDEYNAAKQKNPKQPANSLYNLFKPISELNPPLISKNTLDQLADKYTNFYLKEKDRKTDRTPISKNLGRFTVEALSKLQPSINTSNQLFKGIDLRSNLLGEGQQARGLFNKNYNRIGDKKPNTLYINPDVTQDVLSTLVHEGNHTIEYHKPRVANSFANYTGNKNYNFDKKAELYKNIQNIIGLKDNFTDLYNLNSDNDTAKYEEIPAFALEAMMQNNHKWNIDENTPEDARKVFRRVLKDTHNTYRDLGLVNRDGNTLPNTGYKYNDQNIPKYDPKHQHEDNKGVFKNYQIYSDADNKLFELIDLLKNVKNTKYRNLDKINNPDNNPWINKQQNPYQNPTFKQGMGLSNNSNNQNIYKPVSTNMTNPQQVAQFNQLPIMNQNFPPQQMNLQQYQQLPREWNQMQPNQQQRATYRPTGQNELNNVTVVQNKWNNK